MSRVKSSLGWWEPQGQRAKPPPSADGEAAPENCTNSLFWVFKMSRVDKSHLARFSGVGRSGFQQRLISIFLWGPQELIEGIVTNSVGRNGVQRIASGDFSL